MNIENEKNKNMENEKNKNMERFLNFTRFKIYATNEEMAQMALKIPTFVYILIISMVFILCYWFFSGE